MESVDPNGVLLGVMSGVFIIIARALAVFLKSRNGLKAMRSLLEDTGESKAVPTEATVTTAQLSDALTTMTRISQMATSLHGELQLSRADSQKEREEWQRQTTVWANERQVFNARMAASDQRIDALEKALADTKTEIKALQHQLEITKGELARTHDEMQKAQGAANRYQIENHKLINDKLLLTQRVEELENELAKVRTALEIATARITELEKRKTGELPAMEEK